MSLDFLDTPLVCVVPSDPETSPEAIWKRQVAEVREALKRGVDRAELSQELILPAWSVERIAHYLLTGKRWVFPCPKAFKKSAAEPSKQRRKIKWNTSRNSGTGADGTAA